MATLLAHMGAGHPATEDRRPFRADHAYDGGLCGGAAAAQSPARRDRALAMREEKSVARDDLVELAEQRFIAWQSTIIPCRCGGSTDDRESARPVKERCG